MVPVDWLLSRCELMKNLSYYLILITLCGLQREKKIVQKRNVTLETDPNPEYPAHQTHVY